MDTDLLRTFLEINRTRHFGHAAENLHLTQSAVSARIRLLEETLGIQLFIRSRNNIQLTPAGSRLLQYAESILNTWNRARHDTALGQEDRTSLAIGGMFSLWDILLQDWIQRLYRKLPNLAIRAEANGPEVLVRKLLDGALDVAFMFEPPQMVELQEREISRIQLIMISSLHGQSASEAIKNNYILVDWGTAFAIAHARHFPDMPPPTARMGLGRMALAFILECGGATYLAEPMVREYLDSGSLHRVRDAPVIDRQVYAIYLQDTERGAMLEQALELLTPVASSTAKGPDFDVQVL
jgi:LysR family transcriptional regulator, flagellar master operon regulator